MNTPSLENIIEFALLTANKPLSLKALKKMLEEEAVSEDAIKQAINQLEQNWHNRAFTLIQTASGYQFISCPQYLPFLQKLNPTRPTRLSRSLLEVLSIIIYHQPATRGDIEKIRSIAVSPKQIEYLEELQWIEAVGQRETPGRPTLYAPTKTLLDDLALTSFDDLPQLQNTTDIAEIEDEPTPTAPLI